MQAGRFEELGFEAAPPFSSRLAAATLALAWLATACTSRPALTPRLQDASAPGDFYRALRPAERTCERDVAVLSAAEVGGRSYREVSMISATCYPGAPNACRQTLRQRACELHADALILTDGESGGTPLGASSQSVVSLSAHAVNWAATD